MQPRIVKILQYGKYNNRSITINQKIYQTKIMSSHDSKLSEVDDFHVI